MTAILDYSATYIFFKIVNFYTRMICVRMQVKFYFFKLKIRFFFRNSRFFLFSDTILDSMKIKIMWSIEFSFLKILSTYLLKSESIWRSYLNFCIDDRHLELQRPLRTFSVFYIFLIWRKVQRIYDSFSSEIGAKLNFIEPEEVWENGGSTDRPRPLPACQHGDSTLFSIHLQQSAIKLLLTLNMNGTPVN